MAVMPIDSRVVDAAKSGDPEALNELLACSRQDLRRYAEYHCIVNDVEDAVQETLFKASRRLSDLRRTETFTSWLFRIVKRECNRMRRGWRLLTNQDIDEAIQPVMTPEPLELRIEISRAMAVLPPHYRTILLMRDVDGLTLNETAAQLGLEFAATKSRLHRARAVMRELLSGYAPRPLDRTRNRRRVSDGCGRATQTGVVQTASTATTETRPRPDARSAASARAGPRGTGSLSPPTSTAAASTAHSNVRRSGDVSRRLTSAVFDRVGKCLRPTLDISVMVARRRFRVPLGDRSHAAART